MTATANLRARSLVPCILLAFAARAAAQPPAPKPDEPPPRLEANGQFTLLATTGNASTTSIGAAGDLISRADPWTYTAKLAFAQTEDDDEVSARSFIGLFRAARALGPRLSAYAQYDYLRDVFAGIEHRHTMDGGLSYLLVDRAPHTLRLDGSLGYQYESRVNAESFDSAIALAGAGYRLRISETSTFTDDARIVLTLADMGAWKFEQVASLTAAITTVLSLKLSNTIRYANEPVPGFEKTDTITSVAIVARIRRP